MTHLRKMMLEELQRRNYSQTTVRGYMKAVQAFAEHFRRPPDQLGLDHIPFAIRPTCCKKRSWPQPQSGFTRQLCDSSLSRRSDGRIQLRSFPTRRSLEGFPQFSARKRRGG